MPDYQLLHTFLEHVFEIADFILYKLFLHILAVIGVIAVIRQHLKKK